MMSKMYGLMTFFVCTLYVVNVESVSEELEQFAVTLHNMCVEEIGVSEDLIERGRTGDFADDDKLKCYMKCLMDQMALIDDDGMVDIDAVLSILPDELKTDAKVHSVKVCGTKIGVDHCDNAFLTNKCWYEMDPEGFFLL